MIRFLILVGAAAGVLAGCATRSETYALLPGKDGKAEPLTVIPTEGRPLVLERPYSAATGDGREVVVADLGEAAVRQQFAAALAATPLPPKSFVLYFLEGSDELTAESRAEVGKVFAEIAARPAPDIVVIGHTDRVGRVEDNDALSRKRADKLRTDLIRQGIAAASIQAAGRGEREPLVATADEVREAKNRRVEILVR